MNLQNHIFSTLFVVVSLAHFSCDRNDDPDQVAGSELKFQTFLSPSSCLMRRAGEDKIRICIVGNGNQETVKDKSSRALQVWLDALDPAANADKTKIEFSCESADIRINAWSGGGGGESGGPQQINIADGSAFGTYIHEFGHAFACLGDTYVGGMAGQCAAGQPHSVMCDGLLRNDLSQDDIDGIRYQYKQLVKAREGENPNGDDDKDGVLNKHDRCPMTPEGKKVWRDDKEPQWRGCSEGQTPVL